MAAPSFINAGSPASSNLDISVGLPSGWAQNDILILFVETADQAVSTPSGWTQVTGSPSAYTSSTRLTAFWKRAGASESAVTITDPGNHALGVMIAVRGCPTTGDPFDDYDAGNGVDAGSPYVLNNAGTPGVGSITTTVADTLIVFATSEAADDDTDRWSSWTCSDITSFTERVDVGTTQGNGGGIAVVTGTRGTAGTVDGIEATCDIACTFAWLLLSLKPGGTTTDRAVSGSATPSGAVTKQANKAATGSVTATGAAVRAVALAVVGALTAVGAPLKRATAALAGSVTPTGATLAIKIFLLALAGSITATGATVRSIAAALAATLTATGATVHSVGVSVGGSLTAAASLVRAVAATFTGSLTAAGIVGAVKLSAQVFEQAVGGTITAAGALGRSVAAGLQGALTATGDLVRQTAHALARSLTPSAALNAVKQAGGIVHELAVNGFIAANSALSRVVGVTLTGATTASATLSRVVGATLAGAIVAAGVLIKTIGVIRSGLLVLAGIMRNWDGRAIARTSAALLDRATTQPALLWQATTSAALLDRAVTSASLLEV